MKVKKPDTTNSVFKSTTGRLLEDNIKKASRVQAGAPGQYEPSMTMGKQPIQGGAPNNFLLMKNEKLVAPFQSTVTRFKSQEPPETSDYYNSKQASLANALHGFPGLIATQQA